MKKIINLMAITLLTVMALVLNSCSNDDDPVAEYKYSMGFVDSESANSDELKRIEGIYYSYLSVTTSDFILRGTEKECNDKIIDACDKAQKEVAKIKWKSSFTFEVVLVSKNKTVYHYSYVSQE